MKASPLRRLERIANRRTQVDCIIGVELARTLTEVAHAIGRQVGLLIDRRGDVAHVMVGDARHLLLPDISSYRRGGDRLCGLRLVHTHLNGEPLNDEDLTDLALLRLDFVAAIEVLDDGLPGLVHAAHLLPGNATNTPWTLLPAVSVHNLLPDFIERMDALDAEAERLRKPRLAGDNRDRVILLHISTLPRSVADERIAELSELARSAGMVSLESIIQRRTPDPRYVAGQGKIRELIIRAMQLGAEALVFDMNLSPSQLQSLAAYTELKILDRTQVILDIFAQHAATREARVQVELAQLRYMLPRLGAKQSALAFSRLTGGIGGRGPGETKLEIDRRRAQDRIALLERELNTLGGRRQLRRRQRVRKGMPTVSIVGYTNAGKSTLLNHLTRSSVIAEDALFATLNPVSRRLRFPQEREVIITDTVGFIRDLPKELMGAFRTTLEELHDADLLLHVLDASSMELEEHHRIVLSLLRELGLADTPVLTVFNKSDLCEPDRLESLMSRHEGFAISALDSDTFHPLLDAMERCLWERDSVGVPSAGYDWSDNAHETDL